MRRIIRIHITNWNQRINRRLEKVWLATDEYRMDHDEPNEAWFEMVRRDQELLAFRMVVDLYARGKDQERREKLQKLIKQLEKTKADADLEKDRAKQALFSALEQKLAKHFANKPSRPMSASEQYVYQQQMEMMYKPAKIKPSVAQLNQVREIQHAVHCQAVATKLLVDLYA